MLLVCDKLLPLAFPREDTVFAWHTIKRLHKVWSDQEGSQEAIRCYELSCEVWKFDSLDDGEIGQVATVCSSQWIKLSSFTHLLVCKQEKKPFTAPRGGVREVVPWRASLSITVLLHSNYAKYKWLWIVFMTDFRKPLNWMQIYWSPACVLCLQHSMWALGKCSYIWCVDDLGERGDTQVCLSFLLVLTCIGYIQWHNNLIFSFDGKQNNSCIKFKY